MCNYILNDSIWNCFDHFYTVHQKRLMCKVMIFQVLLTGLTLTYFLAVFRNVILLKQKLNSKFQNASLSMIDCRYNADNNYVVPIMNITSTNESISINANFTTLVDFVAVSVYIYGISHTLLVKT